MENKQTALDIFIEEINKTGGTKFTMGGKWIVYFDLDAFELARKKAKAMEKEQMIDFANDLIAQNDTNYIAVPDKAEEYYKQIYGN